MSVNLMPAILGRQESYLIVGKWVSICLSFILNSVFRVLIRERKKNALSLNVMSVTLELPITSWLSCESTLLNWVLMYRFHTHLIRNHIPCKYICLYSDVSRGWLWGLKSPAYIPKHLVKSAHFVTILATQPPANTLSPLAENNPGHTTSAVARLVHHTTSGVLYSWN